MGKLQRLMVLCLGVMISVSLMAQNSKDEVVRHYNPSILTSLRIEGPMEVFVDLGEVSSVRIVGNHDIVGEVDYSERGQEVYLRLNKTKGTLKNEEVKVYITMQSIRQLNLSNGVDVLIEEDCKSEGDLQLRLSTAAVLKCGTMSYEEFFVELNSASTINGTFKGKIISFSCESASKFNGTIECNECFASLWSASKATLKGQVGEMTLKGASASSVNAEKLEVKRLKAELSSASKCTIKVEEELSFNISSGSRLNYSGQPVMSGMNVSGGAKVKQLK